MTFPLQWYLLFLVSIPQVFLVGLVGLALFNLRISTKRLLIIAVIGGTISFALRFVSMVFGLQIFICLFVMTALTILIGRIRIFPAVCAITAGLVAITVIETSLLPLYLIISKTTLANLQANQIITVLLFIPEVFIMILIYLATQRYKFSMWDLNNVGQVKF